MKKIYVQFFCLLQELFHWLSEGIDCFLIKIFRLLVAGVWPVVLGCVVLVRQQDQSSTDPFVKRVMFWPEQSLIVDYQGKLRVTKSDVNIVKKNTVARISAFGSQYFHLVGFEFFQPNYTVLSVFLSFLSFSFHADFLTVQHGLPHCLHKTLHHMMAGIGRPRSTGLPCFVRSQSKRQRKNEF